MRCVALIYNPNSGQHSTHRKKIIEDVLAELRAAGLEVHSIPTTSAASAAGQALDAMRSGCDTILACGGDGTVHDVLQSLVGNTEFSAALGVIPMGTANALAMDLGLSRSPVKAVRQLISALAVTIPVGRLTYRDNNNAPQSRYFVVAAGVGPDALFLSQLDPGLKRRFGYLVYILEAARLWATHNFPVFTAAFHSNDEDAPRIEQVSQLLAVRIRNFGGVLNHLVPDAALSNRRLRLIAFKTRSRLRYLRFLLAVIFARHKFSSIVELIHATHVECTQLPGATQPLYVEADGELLGTLPARIEVIPQAIRLLVPEKLLRQKVVF